MTSHAVDCAHERVQQEDGMSSAWGLNAPTPGQLSEFFAQIKSGRITKSRMQEILRWDIRTEWEDFYVRVMGIKVDFSEILIPEHKPGFNRVIIMAQGLLISQALAACKFSYSCLWSDPDSAIAENERSPKDGSYAIRVLDRQEADEELKDLSAEDIVQSGIKTEIVLERVIHELKYHDETGGHLDVKNITLMAGSRVSGGDVPSAYWRSKFCLYCYHPGDAVLFLCARQVVSL